MLQQFFRKSPLERQCFVLDSLEDLNSLLHFGKPPTLIEDDLDETRFTEDMNSRRRRDAEVLSAVSANAEPGKMLDIGTHLGRSAARMAANSPESTIYTVNVHPNEFRNAGKLTTEALSEEEIGSFYREKGLSNINQIFANTKTWQIPHEIDDLTVVYVDGCHDKAFVYSDTKLVYDRVKPGGFILWHDCSPLYRKHFAWIDESMKGIEMLIKERVIRGRILNVRNSWIGVYQKIK
jgi:predicted O-methyltransferase YrrM